MSVSGIGGIISGFDTQSIISAYTKIQQTQIESLEVRQLELQVQKQACLVVHNLLKEFSSAVATLSSSQLWNTCIATSSNSSALNATLDEYASEGTYIFNVLQLAQAAQATSGGLSSQTSSISPDTGGTITIESPRASLGQGTDLSLLNAGAGISHGIIKITDSTGSSAEIDLRAALTMAEVLEAINSSGLEISASISQNGNGLTITDGNGGAFKVTDVVGTAAADLGIKGTFTGSAASGDIYGLSFSTALSRLNDGLGINDGTAGIIRISDVTSGDAWEIDLSGCETVGHVINRINSETAGAVTASIASDGRSLILSGEEGSLLEAGSIGANNTTAADLGIDTGGSSVSQNVQGTKVLAGMNSVSIRNISGVNGSGLNGTRGVSGAELGSFTMTLSGGGEITFDPSAAGLRSDDSFNDLLSYLNSTAEDAGTGVRFTLNSSGNGIRVINNSGETISFADADGSSLASDMGLDGGSVQNAAVLDSGNLERNYIGRATSLGILNDGAGISGGSFLLTDAGGFSAEIDLSSAKTFADVIAQINSSGLDLVARINDSGDGIAIISTLAPDAENAGTIKVEEVNGGSVASALGLSNRTSKIVDGVAVLEGSQETNIEVSATDSLTDIMNKVNSLTGLSAYIIHDGNEYAPYRLVIAGSSTGSASDFVVTSDISSLGFTSTAKGQDSILLYGSQSSGAEPLLMRSSTNTNNSVVKGMTLNLTAVSGGEVSITVARDNSAIVTAIETMIDAYNNLNTTVLDMLTYVPEDDSGTSSSEDTTTFTGLLYGDSSTRLLLNEINRMFSSIQEGNKSLRTFRDLGITFALSESTDSSGTTKYSSNLSLDSESLLSLLDTNFNEVMNFFCKSEDAALSANGAAITTNGGSDGVTSAKNLINGNTSSGDFGVSNGYQAGDTIANGADTITVNFGSAVLVDYIVLYHIDSADMPAADYALRDFTVEYLNSQTGKWEVLRSISGNTGSYTVISPENPVYASAVRITATGTNAADGIMRLVEIQVKSEQGVASDMEYSLNKLLNSQSGYMARKTDLIDGLDEGLDEEIASKTARMEAKEALLWSQFTAMELTLASLQAQGDYFNSVMESLSTGKSK